jgi:hypothetical protein
MEERRGSVQLYNSSIKFFFCVHQLYYRASFFRRSLFYTDLMEELE